MGTGHNMGKGLGGSEPGMSKDLEGGPDEPLVGGIERDSQSNGLVYWVVRVSFGCCEEQKRLQGRTGCWLQTSRQEMREAEHMGLEKKGFGCQGPEPGGQRVLSPSFSVHLSCPQVTLIPTFDSVAMHEWYEETHAQHQALGITVLGSNSTVSMQDEAFPACKVEF